LTCIERKFYNSSMDGIEKLKEIKQYMDVEDPETTSSSLLPPLLAEDQELPSCHSAIPQDTKAKADSLPIFHATMQGGRKVPILKTVLTSACERNCYYCAFRSGRDMRRHTFKPEELASIYLSMYTSGAVKGIFLSSGVAGGGIRTQDKLIAAAEVLRNKFHYRGYLHLKIMPGSEYDQVVRTMELADRVSVNLEGPTTERLSRLAPQKMFLEELLTPLRWVEEIRNNQPAVKTWNGRWPSSTTQFVVGGAGESDLELLRASDYLYRKLRLRRAYFSGFKPVEGTPLEGQQAVNPWRTHRLYQASFLLRDYGFTYEDLPFASTGDLPLQEDPKLAWARVNLSQTPLEVNRADLQQLLRIPGIGQRGARAIISARQRNRLNDLNDLKSLGVYSERAAPFILLSGRRPAFQLGLFE
jgi:predicted DNA-binding helix-hairpin-helix protein